MKFFQDFGILTDQKIGITNLLSNITTRDGSHKGGWARLLKCQLKNLGYTQVEILTNKDSLQDFNVIIFDLGAEYSGTLNMFGGLDEKVFKRLTEIRAFSGRLFSWKNDVPSLNALESRRQNKSTCEHFKSSEPQFLPDVEIKLSKCQTFRHVYCTKALLIGDSHTPSVWTPDYMIERQDGRTLFGALKNGTIEELVTRHPDVDSVMIHMSSIDVRHHICRLEKQGVEIADLASRLSTQLNEVRGQFNLKNVSIMHTVGIEDESRELPKTGYYKGTPFYGSWEERNLVRNVYNAIIEELAVHFGFEVVKFPWHFFDESGKLKFEVMELPQSVHLSPEFYRWDLENNILRWEK